MSHNYDNWEKLVRKVLRREDDKYLAMLDDWPSECGTSFASSSSQLNFEVALPTDHSDLMANHTDWKTLLPLNQEEIVWSSASLSFSVDRRTGRNCFMVGARELTLSTDDMAEMIKNRRSRFLEVSEIGFDESMPVIIQGSMAMERLSPGTLYRVFIVFDFKAPNESSNNSIKTNIHGSYPHPTSAYDDYTDTNRDNYYDTYSFETEGNNYAGVGFGVDSDTDSNNNDYDDYEAENNNDIGVGSSADTDDDVGELSSELVYPLFGSSFVGACGDQHFSESNSVKLHISSRTDGWKEVELGSHYIGEEQSGVLDAILELTTINKCLMVEGFEFRPCSVTEPFQGSIEVVPKKVGLFKSRFFISKLFR